jgi:hypothetical protein
LGDDLAPSKLSLIAPNTIDFNDLPAAFDQFIDGSHTARTVVAINPE